MADIKSEVLFTLKVVQKGDKLEVVTNRTKKLSKETDNLEKKRKKLTNTTDKYNRREKGAAQISSNSTKNFSKMQHSIDGGGGSGGLVRAYALLAANVFALSAAFGILSRASQVDTLTESMTQLEIVSGNSIRATARDLQAVTDNGLSMAESMRSVSLAMSAGFKTDTITELGEVARNAAVSLGRNMPDALDRIFRGIIKVEPELLDEIGLFIRVNEASALYASTLGIAAGDLTNFQKRQAFANEGIRQGTEKFKAFSEIKTDPYSRLATSFADLTQSILSKLAPGIEYVVGLLADNPAVLTGAFAALAASLLRLVIPAMGSFTIAIANNAAEAKTAAAEQKAALEDRVLKSQQANISSLELQKTELKGAVLSAKTSQSYKGRGEALKQANSQLAKAVGNEEKIAALENKSAVLNKSRRKSNAAAIDKEQAAIANEIKQRKEILKVDQQIQQARNNPASQAGPGSKANLDMQKALRKEITSTGLANVAATAETLGFKTAMGSLTTQLNIAKTSAKQAGVSFGFLRQGLFMVSGAAVAAQVALTRLMMVLGPYIMALTLLSPVIVFLVKKMGFFSEEAKAMKEATKSADESMSVFAETVAHASEAIQGVNFTKAREGALALSKEIESTSKDLVAMADATRDYYENTNGFVFFFTTTLFRRLDHLTGVFSKKQIDQMKEFVNTLSNEANRAATSFAVLELIDGAGDSAEELVKVIKAINEIAPDIAAAQENLSSAIDGAKDSARAFRDTFIVKTDVDQVLASFRQVTSALQLANISAQDINIAFGEILTRDDKTGAFTSPIAAIMTREHLAALKEIDKETDVDGKQRLAVLEEVELMYHEQQKVLIMTKNELKRISQEQALYKSLLKESNLALEVNLQLTQTARKLNIQMLKFDRDRAATNLHITTERLKELALIEDISELVGEEDIKNKSISQVLAAVNKQREYSLSLVKEEMALATDQLKIDLQSEQNTLRRLQGQERLNSLQAKASQLALKREQFAGTGSTKLSLANQIKSINIDETARRKTAKQRENLEKAISKIKYDIIKAETNVLKRKLETEQSIAQLVFFTANFLGTATKEQRDTWKQINIDVGKITDDLTAISDASSTAAEAITQAFANEGAEFVNKILQAVEKIKGSDVGGERFNTLLAGQGLNAAFETKNEDGKSVMTDAQKQAAALNLVEERYMKMSKDITELLGDDGVLLAAITNVTANMIDLGQNFAKAFDPKGSTTSKIAAVATVAAGAIQQVMALTAASAQQGQQEMDKLIKAEQKRDGKSKESLAKIASMEKKKEAMKRKAFEQNKKLMLAQAVMSTAAAVATALVGPPGLPWSAVMAGMAAALGLAQVSIIKGMTYQGGGSAGSTAPSSIGVGKRDNKVDVAKGATAGESSYLRGGMGVGSNANNFRPAAAGMKSYASGGEILVGKRGPEIISPMAPVEVTPNDKIGGMSNVNFTINAVDAAGVEQLLVAQKGNIIGMIREAANEHGEEFMEGVNTNAYGGESI